MNLMPPLSRYVDWLCESYRADVRVLAIVRILFALYILLWPTDWMWVSSVPDAFYSPRPGLFWWFSGSPSEPVVTILETIRIVVALSLLIGWQTRSASILITLLAITASGFSYSYGKVDHYILIEILPLFLAWAGWGGAYSLDARKHHGEDDGLPVFLWAMVIAFGYFSAMIPKAASGWLDPHREGTRGFVALDIVDNQKLGVLSNRLFEIDSAVLWKFFDYSALFLEGWLVIAILVPTLFRIGIVLICAMHIGIYLILGINFFEYFLVYAVFLSPWFVYFFDRQHSSSSYTWLPSQVTRNESQSPPRSKPDGNSQVHAVRRASHPD